MQTTTLLNRIEDLPVDTALNQSRPIALQWSEELRRIVATHPRCRLLKELLNLDLYNRAVLFLLLVKGWSPRRIADRLKVSLVTIQKLLETSREQLKSKLAGSDFRASLLTSPQKPRGFVEGRAYSGLARKNHADAKSTR
jgi:DNA-directed RNA polymerase specialized sigma24 family protein